MTLAARLTSAPANCKTAVKRSMGPHPLSGARSDERVLHTADRAANSIVWVPHEGQRRPSGSRKPCGIDGPRQREYFGKPTCLQAHQAIAKRRTGPHLAASPDSMEPGPHEAPDYAKPCGLARPPIGPRANRHQRFDPAPSPTRLAPIGPKANRRRRFWSCAVP